MFAAFRLNFIADLLAFIEALQARTFDRTDVDEHVLAAAIGLYKAEPLCGVEPLNRSEAIGCFPSKWARECAESTLTGTNVSIKTDNQPLEGTLG